MKKLRLATAIAAIFTSSFSFAEVTADDNALTFSGYARYGMHYADNGNDYVQADGQLAGNAAGRLGNEGWGGEYQFSKGFDGPNGTKWDIVLMLENWGKDPGDYGDVALKKFYAGVSNVFPAQPDLYIWAGRDFHQRWQQGLNDYYYMTHDGQGAGFKNLSLGGVMLDVGAVTQPNDEGTGDSDNYAITTRLHGITIADALDVNLFANYGFSSEDPEAVTPVPDIKAFQVAMKLSMSSQNFIVRYSDNADNSAFSKTDGLKTLYTSFDGALAVTDQAVVEYQLSYHDYDSADKAVNRSNYSAIVRPTYAWNQVHSTWLEGGYSLVDYHHSESNKAWKFTLSQNISMGGEFFDRPMIRFYTTVGKEDNKVSSTGALNAGKTKHDTFVVGAMWEGWW
jgi:maltoporin